MKTLLSSLRPNNNHAELKYLKLYLNILHGLTTSATTHPSLETIIAGHIKSLFSIDILVEAVVNLYKILV